MEGLRTAISGQSLPCRQLPGRAAKANMLVSCVATPVKPPSAKPAKRSKVEIVKEKSDFLRHPLMEELVNENTYINEDAVQLMKFHGSYQQDHREKRAFGQGKFYQFMMRTRQPGGVVPNQLYLTMDDLSEQVWQQRACATVAAVLRHLPSTCQTYRADSLLSPRSMAMAHCVSQPGKHISCTAFSSKT